MAVLGKITAQEAEEMLDSVINNVNNEYDNAETEEDRKKLNDYVEIVAVPIYEGLMELINDPDPEDIEDLKEITDDVPAYLEFIKKFAEKLEPLIERARSQSN